MCYCVQGLSYSGKAVHLRGHDGPINCMVACKPFSIVVTGSTDKTCIVWDTNRYIELCVCRNNSCHIVQHMFVQLFIHLLQTSTHTTTEPSDLLYLSLSYSSHFLCVCVHVCTCLCAFVYICACVSCVSLFSLCPAICSRLYVFPYRLSYVNSLVGHEGEVSVVATSPTLGDIASVCSSKSLKHTSMYIHGWSSTSIL